MFSFFKRLFSSNKFEPSDTIYVGNLIYSATTHDLKDAFADFGEIRNARIIKDNQTRRSKGFGFVTFNDETEAERALDMEGHLIKGRPIRVRFAQSKAHS